MPFETSNKSNIKNKNEPLIQLSHKQLEEPIQCKITNTIKPLERKIAVLRDEVKSMKESLSFLSEKHDDLTNEYSEVVRINNEQKKDIKLLNKRANNLQKKNEDDKIKVN